MARKKTRALASGAKNRCPATRKDGSPCTAKAGPDGFCVGHRDGAQDARRKGGQATSKAARLQRSLPIEIRPAVDRLLKALGQVHDGSIPPAIGTALASMTTALLKALDAGETAERLRAIESKLNGGGNDRAED